MRIRLLAAGIVLLATWGASAGLIAEKALEAERLSETGEFVKAIDELNAAIEELWAKMPLTARNVQQVTEATGYGVYVARENNVYKTGEKVFVYTELLGYQLGRDSIGNKLIAVDLGIELKDEAGKTLFTVDKGMSFSQAVRVFNKEFFFKVDLNFKGVPPGKYVTALTVTDRASKKSTVFDVDFEIIE